MTTIAWKGKHVAADRGGVKCERMHRMDKLFELETGDLVAICGNRALGLQMVQWYADGAEKFAFPHPLPDDMGATLIVWPKGENQAYEYTDYPVKVVVECPMAWGSGADMALGAMHAGATADEAVQIASHLDIYTSTETPLVHEVGGE